MSGIYEIIAELGLKMLRYHFQYKILKFEYRDV